nr:MAG TPA: hypothetical protein [Caudoviricetes sp.]
MRLAWNVVILISFHVYKVVHLLKPSYLTAWISRLTGFGSNDR